MKKNNTIISQTTDSSIFHNFDPALIFSRIVNGTENWKQSPHNHSTVEMILVDEGELQVNIDDENYLAQKGDLIIYNANTMHCEISQSPNAVKMYVIRFGNIHLANMKKNVFVPTNFSPVFATEELFDKMKFYFINIYDEFVAKKDNSDRIASNDLQSLLIYIYRMLGKQHNSTILAMGNDTFLTIRHYLDSNYTKKITLENLEKMFFISKFHINHLFVKNCNSSVIKYVTQCRIMLAKDLLMETALSISQIALRCGYSDANYFYRTFKKTTGNTPTDYRKISQK